MTRLAVLRGVAGMVLVATGGCATGGAAGGADPAGGHEARPYGDTGDGGAQWLYAWTASADTMHATAFLAVIDLREGSPTAGRVVRVVTTGPGARGTHHTEHQLQPDRLLFANDFGAGHSFVFDLNDPARPVIHARFTTAGPYGWPHSFVRLPNGNRLVTYQWQAAKFNSPPGGIAEVRTDGSIVRWASARTSDAPAGQITPYSLEILPALDRVVTTSTSMVADSGVHLQVWRLSDLTLLRTLVMPGGRPAGMAAMPGMGDDTMPHHLFPGEPRVLADGKTVMLGTFTCGVYTVTGLDTDQPVVTPVYAFPGENCAVPVTMGRWWLQTVPALHAVVALDVSDPAHPREVSRIALGDSVAPHWLASDLTGRRLVMNTGKGSRLYLLRFDPATGALTPDPVLPVLDLSAVEVPGMGVVRGVPHGTVFSR